MAAHAVSHVVISSGSGMRLAVVGMSVSMGAAEAELLRGFHEQVAADFLTELAEAVFDETARAWASVMVP